MIDSLSALGSYNYTPSSNRNSDDSSLSLEQQETIQDVLSSYDSNNLSSFDALEIVTAFENANIEPSKSFENALNSLGFDARQIGDLAGVTPLEQGNMPPPPPPSKESEDELSDILSELLYGDDENNTNRSNSNAYNNNSTTFDGILDYTSRILSLNDDAKNQVMDLFQNYKPENTQLSSSDVSNVVKNSLQDILSNKNNYNSTSFYA